ncbi:MAG: LuxR C-terminal-related transcriptional regulator [Planctomycetota bacterium]|jgi:DNA-binding NarL/FixJ family response regulator
MDQQEKIRIVLVDDHEIMRDGLKGLFGNRHDMEVVGERVDGTTVGELIREHEPDVLTMGVNIAGVNSIDTARWISQEFPDLKIVAHSMYLEKAFVVEMLTAGACGYVYKGHPFGELVRAVNTVVNGEVYLCSKTTSVVMNGYVQGFEQDGSFSHAALTAREREILKVLADGKSSKETALALHISAKTVDTHRRQIMSKLGLYSLPELTKYAIRCGLTSIS